MIERRQIQLDEHHALVGNPFDSDWIGPRSQCRPPAFDRARRNGWLHKLRCDRSTLSSILRVHCKQVRNCSSSASSLRAGMAPATTFAFVRTPPVHTTVGE